MNKRNIITMLTITAVFFVAPLFVTQQIVFAGQIGCQSGAPNGAPPRDNGRMQQAEFAAAQVKYEQNQPPSSGNLGGSDSPVRSQVSYFASLLFMLGGIWLLFSLLRERWLKRYAPKYGRLAKVWNFALKPSFALSAFAFLFAAIIVGSTLTSPGVTSAQKRESCEISNDEKPSSNLGLPSHQPVFKSAQQIGGSGVTQIGAPIFDTAGNRYVRGAFSGTLTIGNTTLTATYGLDMFIAKYDSNLNPLWVRQGSGMTSAPSEDLATEGATAMSVFESFEEGNSLYVAGSFVKTLTLQGGANPPVTLTDGGAAGYNYEIFIAKYDTNGNLIWARGGNSGSQKSQVNLEIGQNAINKIVFDSFGEPYVAGLVSGDNFLGSSIASFVCSSNQNCSLHGKSDIIVAKLDKTNGVPTRMHVLGGTDDDNALDLAIDNVTNPSIPRLYLIGTIGSPEIQLPNSYGYETFTNTANSVNSFIVKFNSDTFNRTTIDGIWAKVLNNNGIIGVNQVATDPQTGQLYITGYYTGSITGFSGLFGGGITNTRTGTGQAALAGYVASIDTSDGSFFQLVNLGGPGNALAVRPADGVIFVVGTLWNSGQFASSGDVRTLDSLGGTDMFVVGINRGNFSFDSVKGVNGSGYEGQVAVGNPSATDGGTINKYSPFGIAFKDGRVYVSGDFKGTLSLDCITLQTPGTSRQAYVAELGGESTACRIWTNNNPNFRYWDESSNWNAGVIPAENDSVYVPYHRNAVYNPLYNPSFYTPNSNVPLDSVSISDNQRIILQENLTINRRLDLLGGSIDAGSNKLILGALADVYRIGSGRVLGKMEKFFSGNRDLFTFPVGTANGYSPVTLSNINAGESASFAVTANQGAYPNTATDLPVNRAARWWNLTNNGLQSTNLTFQYLPGDITTGTESGYRAYRIPTGGGAAALVGGTIDTTAKTVTVTSVTQFSDWTLAQPLAPTAAPVAVGGRVKTASGRGIPQVIVTVTNNEGFERRAVTNAFGYYRFDDIAPGQSYIFNVRRRGWQTLSSTQVHNIQETRDDIDFIESN